MIRKYIAIIALLCLSLAGAKAQDSLFFHVDSIRMPKYEKVFRTRFVQSTYIGVPLFAGGVIASRENKHFRELRNGFLPSFESELDNYLQYTPAVLPIALKACGVKSESSWGKMITAEAVSFAAVSVVAQGLKRTVHEERPDGSNRHSFPSGHTASAFMSAVILEKEYGHYSPWVGIGAYTMACTTGAMRVMNNRHWVGDVISGAGIGIVSAEFGYWVADRLFPKEGKSFHSDDIAIKNNDANPSFLGFYGGIGLPLKKFDVNNDIALKTSTSGTFGLEGAYFPSRHFGLGGRVSATDICYILDDEDRTEASSHVFRAMVGPYFDCTIYERLFFGARMLAGYTYYKDATKYVEQLRGKGGFCTGTGCSIGLRAKQHLDVRLNFDYSVLSPHSSDTQQWFHGIVISAGANMRF